jgi:hypothetical protein
MSPIGDNLRIRHLFKYQVIVRILTLNKNIVLNNIQ